MSLFRVRFVHVRYRHLGDDTRPYPVGCIRVDGETLVSIAMDQSDSWKGHKGGSFFGFDTVFHSVFTCDAAWPLPVPPPRAWVIELCDWERPASVFLPLSTIWNASATLTAL